MADVKQGIQTRSQQDLRLAEKLVSEVETQGGETARIYGGLCHSFPVLVRTCGLCQALAFSQDKSSGGDGPLHRAHRLLLQHVAAIMGLQSKDPLGRVRDGDALQYLYDTRRVLTTWIFFKRFAVSILRVESSREAEERG